MTDYLEPMRPDSRALLRKNAIMIFAGLCGALACIEFPAKYVFGALVGIFVLVQIIRKPACLVQLLVAAYPLEWSKTLIPFLLLDKNVDGASVSIIDIHRLIATLVIMVALLQFASKPGGVRPRGYVSLVLFLLVVYFAFSAMIIAPDHGKPMAELFRFVYNTSLLVALASLLNSEKRIRSFATAIVYTGFVLGFLGIVQFFTGYYIWNNALTTSGMTRINVTFADPNICARFLIVALVFYFCALGKLPIGRLPSLLVGPLCILAILATFSRSGILGLMVAVILLIAYKVWKTNLKTTILIFGSLLLVGLFTLVNEALVQRLGSFSSGIGALGARIALINTAIHMFLDHPVLGVGLGSFRTVALSKYTDLLPYGGNAVTESHTAFLTIAAETGLIGLLLVGALILSLYSLIRKIGRESSLWFVGIAAWISVLVIVISSQSEGRLLEDPMLYMLSAVIVAVYRIRSRDKI